MQKKKNIWQFVSAAVSAASWTTYEMKKLSENEVDTLKKKQQKKKHVLVHQQRIRPISGSPGTPELVPPGGFL